MSLISQGKAVEVRSIAQNPKHKMSQKAQKQGIKAQARVQQSVQK